MPARKSKTGRTQQERSAAMRQRLLDATVDCLVQYGYAGTTTTRVTELAGVTRGAQVHHFPTRADLVAAAARHLATLRMELATSRLDVVRDAPDPIDATLDLVWELHLDPIQHATVEMWIAARTDPELREKMAAVAPVAREDLIDFCAAIFADHRADRGPYRRLARTCLDTARGIALLGLSNPDTAQLEAWWQSAKTGLRQLIDAGLVQPSEPSVRMSGAR